MRSSLMPEDTNQYFRCVYFDDEICPICYQPLRLDFLVHVRDTTRRLRDPHYHHHSPNEPRRSAHQSANTYSTRKPEYPSYDLVARLESVIAQIHNETPTPTLSRIRHEAEFFLRWQPRFMTHKSRHEYPATAATRPDHDRKGDQTSHSPQTTNDANADSVSTTRNSLNNRRGVTILGTQFEDQDRPQWPPRGQRSSEHHSENGQGDHVLNAPMPRQSSLPPSDIEDPTSFPPTRERHNTSTTPSDPALYERSSHRADNIQASSHDTPGFDSAIRPKLHINIPQGPTFRALSSYDPSPHQARPWRSAQRRSESYPTSPFYDTNDHPRASHVATRCRSPNCTSRPEDDGTETERDDVSEAGPTHSIQVKMKKRAKLKGKARASSPGYFDVSASNAESGRANYSTNRPTLSRCWDPLFMNPRFPSLFTPFLNTHLSSMASDSFLETQTVRIHRRAVVEERSPVDEQQDNYRLNASLEMSPPREVPIGIDIKPPGPILRTPGSLSDRTLSTLYFPSPYTSPRFTEMASFHRRSDRRPRPSSSKLTLNLDLLHIQSAQDGYLSEGSSNGAVSSATAVQASPRHPLATIPVDDSLPLSSPQSHHVHFSESAAEERSGRDQGLVPIPPEPCTPPDRRNTSMSNNPSTINGSQQSSSSQTSKKVKIVAASPSTSSPGSSSKPSHHGDPVGTTSVGNVKGKARHRSPVVIDDADE
ncbi:hypothetical protein CVT24_011398 [Panaeolus cyanescens]|uniref:Uncharacterized protein n=1 Tax=Panaeolus cyanescens TaxID=181874 RepID=A0A409YGM6_9AGAR|nr:hypothetical protein CVT24_011398 [Panaeolus cyanescens]